MSEKTKFKLLLGVIVTLLVVYYSFKVLGGLDLSTVFSSKIKWFLVFVSVVISGYSNYIRGLGYTLGIDPKINRLTALQIVAIGHAANMILPLHIGDGLRLAFFPADYSTLRRTELVMVPAIADSIAIIIISLFAVPFSGFIDPMIVNLLWILFFSCIALLALLLVVFYFVPQFRTYVQDYLTIGMLKMMLWVFLSYLVLLLSIWVGLIAFGFGWEASWRMSLAVFAATNLIGFIPASPGSVGLFEYAVVIGLAGLGIQHDAALSAGLLLHLIQYAALLPLGIFLSILALHGKYGKVLRSILRQKP